MLVLTRKVGEKVIIGDKISLVVAAVEKGRVQLAFDAPKDVLILRAEIAAHQNPGRAIEPNLAASTRCQGTEAKACSGL
jgi:carbon storage regulator